MRLVLIVINLVTGALVFAIPNMIRREVLFAVPVPPGSRESPAGRGAIANFRATVAVAVLAGVCGLLLSPPRYLNAVALAAPLVMVLAAGIAFYHQNRRLAPQAVQFTRPREAELSVAPDNLPRFAWLAAGPFVILAAAARFLYVNWSRIPARFPVHWGANGRPNRWVERSTKSVYGLLFFGAEICAFFLIMTLACWFGARRSRFRVSVMTVMIAAEYVLGLLFTLIALQPVLGIPVTLIAFASTSMLVTLVIVAARKMSNLGEPMDPTPNECWKGAIFYYNPDDAALFVEKRDGWGYTFNFANRWSWVLLAGLGVVIASVPYVLA